MLNTILSNVTHHTLTTHYPSNVTHNALTTHYTYRLCIQFPEQSDLSGELSVEAVFASSNLLATVLEAWSSELSPYTQASLDQRNSP